MIGEADDEERTCEQTRNITSCVVRKLPERSWIVVVVSIP